MEILSTPLNQTITLIIPRNKVSKKPISRIYEGRSIDKIHVRHLEIIVRH